MVGHRSSIARKLHLGELRYELRSDSTHCIWRGSQFLAFQHPGREWHIWLPSDGAPKYHIALEDEAIKLDLVRSRAMIG